MGKAVTAIHPNYIGDFTLGGGITVGTITTFTWNGIHWTPEFIFARFSLIVIALALTFLAAFSLTALIPHAQNRAACG